MSRHRGLVLQHRTSKPKYPENEDSVATLILWYRDTEQRLGKLSMSILVHTMSCNQIFGLFKNPD